MKQISILFIITLSFYAQARTEETYQLAAVIEQIKLAANDGSDFDNFGLTVSIEGNRIAIGVPFDDNLSGDSRGSVYIFDFYGNSWSQTKKLKLSNSSSIESFGTDVSLSGNRLLVGAKDGKNSGVITGSAYIYELVSNNWVQTAKLIASDGVSLDEFGSAVSLQGDLAIIGAPLGDNNLNIRSGSVYVFENLGGTWLQTFELNDNDGIAATYFGHSLQVSGDTLVVGTLKDVAYVFNYNQIIWSQQAKLTGSDTVSGDYFGHSVSLFGSRIIIGAKLNDDLGNNSGSAYLFEFNGTSWLQSRKFIGSNGNEADNFGESVSINGEKILVGAPNHQNNGAAYLYGLNNSNWVQISKLTSNMGSSGDGFGLDVEYDGSKIIVSAPFSDETGTDIGSTTVFQPEIIFANGFE